MQQRAKLFANGGSQAVRLPAACRFDGDEVFIRRDEATGDVILSRKPNDWDDFLAQIGKWAVPADSWTRRSAITASRIAIRWSRGENDAARPAGHEHRRPRPERPS